MNYEQRYEEALERAKSQLDGAKAFDYDNEQVAHDIRTTVYNIFPELKGDRVRKNLIELFHDTVSNDEIFSDYGLDKTEVLDWLEKQNEPKSPDKAELKFKIGDWVVFNSHHQSIYQVEKIEDGYYILRHTHGGTFRVCVIHDEDLRLWTIQDAKDGDVLWHSNSASNGVFIFKEIRHDGKVLCYCDYDSEDHFCLGEHHTCCWSNDKYIRPAIKEQCDLLFAKIHKAGYEWSNKDRKLIKL